MKKMLKLKDLVLIVLLTALYMVCYGVSVLVIFPLGAFGHSFSPGVQGLIGGIVIYFMNRKIGKMGEYTIFTLLIMAIFALLGGGYLPWLISSLLTALIADLIASHSNRTSPILLGVASGIMHVGQALGAIIPSIFFVDNYISDWVARGQSLEAMRAYAKYTSGGWAVLAIALTFALSFAGIFIGHIILKKHFAKNE